MPTNQQIINKAGTAIQTGSLTHGLLQPEQARKFIQQTFEATNLGPLVRHVMRTSKSGEIDKIGIASRILRAKVENTDDGYRAGVNTNVIEYACKAVRLPWEITEERALLQSYAKQGAITNVDAENDFYVDQSKSIGDETFFNVGLQAVDSAEKLYFSVSTR